MTILFDPVVTWEALKAFPVNRMVVGGSTMYLIIPSIDLHPAHLLLDAWGMRARETIIVVGENGAEFVGIVATYGGHNPPDLTQMPGRLARLTLNDLYHVLGEGVALFTSLVPSGWDWWEPDNIASKVDLWSYPYRPRHFTVDETIVKQTKRLRELFLSYAKLAWQIGDLLNEIDGAGYRWWPVYHNLGLDNIKLGRAWASDIKKLASLYPEHLRDYSITIDEYRKRLNAPRRRGNDAGRLD